MTRCKRLFALLAIAGLLAAGGVALNRGLDPFCRRAFSPAEWATAVPQARGPMARDAIRHVPPGTPAAEVRHMLGEPEPVPGAPGSSVDGFGHRLRHAETWSYWIGSWSGLNWYNLDSAFLYVHVGADGRVVATEITGG